MTDIQPLSPSECATLSVIEANMTPGKWRYSASGRTLWRVPDETYVADFEPFTPLDATGIVELRNTAPRMLATIADLRDEVDSYESLTYMLMPCGHFECYRLDHGEPNSGCALCRISAHEATIAELRKELGGTKVMSSNRLHLSICAISCISFMCGTLMNYFPWVILVALPVGLAIGHVATLAGSEWRAR